MPCGGFICPAEPSDFREYMRESSSTCFSDVSSKDNRASIDGVVADLRSSLSRLKEFRLDGVDVAEVQLRKAIMHLERLADLSITTRSGDASRTVTSCESMKSDATCRGHVSCPPAFGLQQSLPVLLGRRSRRRPTLRGGTGSLQPTGELEADPCTFALNSLISHIWPRIDGYVETLARDTIEPAIDEALPEMLKGGVKFSKITLGKSSPCLGPIRTQHLSDGEAGPIEVHLGIKVSSELDVRITALGISLGISRVSLRGDLVALLTPPTNKPPFFGGVQVYFPNAPSIDIHFSGVAKLAEIPGLRNVIRTAIDDTLAAVCVLPRRVAVDLDEDDAVDLAELAFPEPLGILRLTLYSGSDLIAGDCNVFGRPTTSDPYVVARLGVKTWTSPSVNKTLNPVWGTGDQGLTVDFPVHDEHQLLIIKVWDKDFTNDDLIGLNDGVDVAELLNDPSPRISLPLLTAEGRPGGGSLSVSAEFLSLARVPPALAPALSPAALSSAPSVAHMSFKVLTITGLDTTARYPFRVRLRVLDEGGSTGAVGRVASLIKRFRGRPASANSQGGAADGGELTIAEAVSGASFAKSVQDLAEALQPICVALRERGHSDAQIAEILEVDLPQVQHFLAGKMVGERGRRELRIAQEAQAAELAKRNVRCPRFEEIMRLLVPQWRGACRIELAIFDRKRECIGISTLPLDELLDSEDSRLEGTFEATGGLGIVGALQLKWLV